jgi:hypothetical protein
MATTDTADCDTSDDSPEKCMSLEDMLKRLEDEIAAFEGKKLAQIKKDIDAFLPKKAAVVKEYKDKYAALNDRWAQQNAQVDDLWKAIPCHIETWDAIADECICPRLKEIDDLADDIGKVCTKGPNEAARDEAKAAADAAKAQLDGLIANTQRVDAALTANGKLITEIQALLTGKDRSVAIYSFFFVLAPLHVQLTPELASDECREVLKNLPTRDTICGCAAPTTTGTETVGHASADAAHACPWLINPDHFGNAIDCAWAAVRAANEALGAAENTFAAAPDDLASKTKKLADLQKTLEARIKDCLKTHRPANPCEPAPEPMTAEA